MARKNYKGKFSPQNPKKYKGNPTNICFRSLWERKFMIFCDINPSVLEWSSEEIIIPYFNPLDQKFHRYFVDFWLKIKKKNGDIEIKLIEIKPFKETSKPTIEEGKKLNKSKLLELQTWIINSNKWTAAKEYCKQRNWDFQILTEKDLFKHE